jgi:hypothetical protein
MRRFSLVGGSIAATAFVGLVVACGDPQSRIPTGPNAPSISTIAISGPASVAPGQSAQFTATIGLSNAMSKSASLATNVRWLSSNQSLLRVNSSGLATAQQQMGDATMTAEVTVQGGVRRSTREITIVPDGTFRLVGRVTDSESQTALTSARVEVTPGPLVAATDLSGQYRIYGVPADADVRVTADSYQPFVQTLHLTANATQNFQLTPSAKRLVLSGPYTLAIDVLDACPASAPLPVSLQHRTYDAVLTPTGLATVDVTLTEPRFRINSLGRGNRFTGQVGFNGATFNLGGLGSGFYYYYYYYGPTSYPDVVEQLSNGTFLVVQGLTVTTGTSAGLSGPLGGRLMNWDARFPTGLFPLGACTSSNRFTLTPR